MGKHEKKYSFGAKCISFLCYLFREREKNLSLNRNVVLAISILSKFYFHGNTSIFTVGNTEIAEEARFQLNYTIYMYLFLYPQAPAPKKIYI